jgi:transcriptional regulator with PAS, ATPase and Fis domain
VNVRVVAATNRTLEKEVEAGAFRADLFYRLSVVPVTIPPLRERPSDVGPLAKHFVETFNREFSKRVRRIDDDALDILAAYTWPGNVRELRNVIERSMLLTEGDVLEAQMLPRELHAGHSSRGGLAVALGPGGIDLDELERTLLEAALKRSEGSRSGAGRLLGLSRHQIRNRLKKYGVEE